MDVQKYEDVYGAKASHYLARATQLLQHREKASLFYAAFELRCGVEARLKEYLDAQSETTKRKRNGWKIDHLAGQVEDVFKLNSNKGYKLSVFDTQSREKISSIEYTPVTTRLQKMAKQLGDYLHSQNGNRTSEEKFWSDFQKKLILMHEELNFSCSGNLLAPLLVHPNDSNQRFFCLDGDQRSLFPPGRHVAMHYEIYDIKYVN